jgi:hypothetical protein
MTIFDHHMERQSVDEEDCQAPSLPNTDSPRRSVRLHPSYTKLFFLWLTLFVEFCKAKFRKQVFRPNSRAEYMHQIRRLFRNTTPKYKFMERFYGRICMQIPKIIEFIGNGGGIPVNRE